MTKEVWAMLAIRWLGFVFLCVGLVWMAGNLVDTLWDFNPNYWWHFVRSQLLRPGMFVALGIGCLCFYRPLALWLAKCD
jgi:hypothetical protein